MTKPHVIILGGGPAGCGAAYSLRRSGKARVTVIEQGPEVGGNAGSFRLADQWVDFGSHRLHHACSQTVLTDIRRFLGSDLRRRDRHGRIRLRRRWIHFPLKAGDLLLRLDRKFALGAAWDMTTRLVPRSPSAESATFASVLRAHLGSTICEDFYFPYARKIWGLEPENISAEQARKRVSAGSFVKLLKRIIRPPGNGTFFYPRQGYGQITRAYAAAAADLGAEIRLGTRVERLHQPADSAAPWSIQMLDSNGNRGALEADYIFSTIPLTRLADLAQPSPPANAMAGAKALDYRAMLLIYLRIPVDRFTETDAHYFPESDVSITRLSEPKNYFGVDEPTGSTVLCAELPCSTEDPAWRMTDEELGERVSEELTRVALPLPAPPSEIHTRRLRHAYPVYRVGFEEPFEKLDSWASSLPRFLSFGRQGLFVHDNTHHALTMAYAVTECLGPGGIDRELWNSYRQEFEQHVVED